MSIASTLSATILRPISLARRTLISTLARAKPSVSAPRVNDWRQRKPLRISWNKSGNGSSAGARCCLQARNAGGVWRSFGGCQAGALPEIDKPLRRSIQRCNALRRDRARSQNRADCPGPSRARRCSVAARHCLRRHESVPLATQRGLKISDQAALLESAYSRQWSRYPAS